MNELYDRVCSVIIGGKEFSSPPFSIEFTQTAKIGTLMACSLKLYNPNNDTIKMFEAKKVGRAKIYPKILIDAGYKEKHGTCTIGEVSDFKVSYGPPDRILEAKIGDISSKWINGIINQTYNNMTADLILRSVLGSVGVGFNNIELGEKKTYKTLTIRKFSDGIRQICKDTKSEFTFKNGLIRITPTTPRLKKATLISPRTGLIGRPEKIATGYKIKTLFLYDIEIGDYIVLQSENINSNFKVTQYSKKFSSFGAAGCEFEVRPL